MATLKLRRGSSFTSPQISEPFFNTSNNTVLVGYGTEDGEQITLVNLGGNTGSVELTGDITASNITLTGDLSARNVSLSGNIIIGDEIQDNITVQGQFSGSLIPSSSNDYDLGSSTKKWRNLFVVSASIDDVTLPGSNIVSSSQQISDYTKFLEIDGDDVVSGSIQIDHDSTTNFVSNEHINHTQVSIFAGSGMSGGGNIAGNRTITLSTGSVHFLDGVKKKLNTETVVSGSIQVDHDATTNFVSNEHINHTSVTMTAGAGLTGGGTIASTRTFNVESANNGIVVNTDNIELINDSSTFTDGVKAKLNTETVISGSSQVNADNVTNFDSNVKDKLNVEDVISGSSQVILNDADYTGFDTNDIAEGSSNLYYTDARVKTKLNAETVISGSVQVNANTITNFDSNVKDKLNVEDVVSGSAQITSLPSVDTDDLTEGSSNLYYTDTRVKTKLNTETVVSGSTQINLNHLDTDDLAEGSTNLYYTNTRVKTKLNTETVVSGSSQVPMGGDISGNANNTTVIKVQGVALTSAEATQLSNIGTSTISSTQWGYLGASNQGIATTDNVVFNNGDFTGNVEVTGNLTVLGSATEIQTSELRIEDKLITVASGSLNSAAADGAGIEIAGADKSLKWDHNTTSFVLDAKVSSSVGFKGEGGELTGIDTDQVTEGSNLYYTDSRVKTKLNAEDVISGSTQININHLDTDDLSEGSTNLYYTDARVKAKLNTETVFSGSSQVNADTITNFDTNVKDKLNTETVISGSSQVDHDATTNFSADEHYTQANITTVGTIGTGVWQGTAIADAYLSSNTAHLSGTQTFSGTKTFTNETTHNGGIKLGDNDKIKWTSDAVHIAGTESGDELNFSVGSTRRLTITETEISSSLPIVGEINAVNGVVSGSVQVNADTITNFDTNVKDKMNSDGVFSGSIQLHTDLDLRYLEITGDDVVSGSIQVDHDATTNFVANEHIDHSSITIGSGKGMSGGGTIDTNRSLSLDTGSAHFDDGIKKIINDENVISGSTFSSPSQGTVRATINGANTNVDTGLQTGDSPTFQGLTLQDVSGLDSTHYNVFMSGSGGVVGKRTLATAAFYHVSSSISDGNTAVLGNAGAVKDYIDEALIAVGAGDITKVTAGAGMSGSTDSGEAVVAIATGSSHFVGGVTSAMNGTSVTFADGDFTGNVEINGNLIVQGSATELQVSELRVEDKLITIASGSANSLAANGAGIEIDRGSDSNITLTWNHSDSRLQTNDDFYVSGTLSATGDIVAYASSDERLKDNISPIKNPIEKINQISGNSFNWNENKQDIYKGKDYGVIAQEIESVLPELVVEREDGYKAVKYDKLVSLLIEGIKELSNEVNQLKQQINKE
jgi:hypothetical protein